MEFFKPDANYNFMGQRHIWLAASALLTVLGIVGVFWPGPNWGTDFSGGTELEVHFLKNVPIADLRKAVAALRFGTPEVVRVGSSQRNYIVRVQSVSPVAPAKARKAEGRLKRDLGEVQLHSFRLSPGGDKLALELSDAVEEDRIREALANSGLEVRAVQPFGKPEDHRYEAFLIGIGDAIMEGLGQRLGNSVVPAVADRVEWVGPKAGAQLRDAGIKSLLYALLLMGIYIAFRFDLRFAPGALVAIIHDVAVALLAMIVANIEVRLATVAAVLTIVGYSVNDTIILYDRIRENLAKIRDADLTRTINSSINEMLGRTVNTTLTTQFSVVALLIFTAGNVREFAFALFFGFLAGVYSSMFVASPITIWLDKRFFRKQTA